MINTSQSFRLFTSENFWDIVKLFGGLGVILIGLAGFVGSLLLQRFVAALQIKNNKELELLKAEIGQKNNRELEILKAFASQNNAFISNLGSNHSATYQKIISKRIEVVEQYWQCIIKVRRSIPGSVDMAYQILADEELTVQNIDKIRMLKDSLASVSARDSSAELVKQSLEIDTKRPFISSKLWILKYTYIGLLGRTMYLVADGYSRGEISLWKNDELVAQFFKLVLTEQEINYIMAMKIGGVKYAVELMESKIIDEINRFISNDDFLNDSVEQFKRTEEIESLKRRASMQV
jgi:hypothetical protein